MNKATLIANISNTPSKNVIQFMDDINASCTYKYFNTLWIIKGEKVTLDKIKKTFNHNGNTFFFDDLID